MKISIITATFNEEDNIIPMHQAVQAQIAILSQEFEEMTYEHIFIDNASLDNTVSKIIEISKVDKNVKLIANTRNFGQLCSPFYGLLQSNGDCTILIAADFQEPPELIPVFVRKWVEGHKVVVGTKDQSEESSWRFFLRKLGYQIYRRIADIPIINNFSGYSLYDKEIIELFRKYKSPTPYVRGLVPLFGLDYYEISFKQARRRAGVSSNNLFTIYDLVMVGLTNFSKFPLRLILYLGVILTVFSLIASLLLVLAKLLLESFMPMGIILIIILQLLGFSLTVLFLGIIGEYILTINEYVGNKPLVVEKFRINFE